MATECGNLPLKFMQMLAAALVKDPETGEILGINTTIENNADCEPAIDCNNKDVDVETMVVEHAFGIDACGNVALKTVHCTNCWG